MQAMLNSFFRRFGPQLVTHLGTLLLGACTVVLMVLAWNDSALSVRISECGTTLQLSGIPLSAGSLQSHLPVRLVWL